MAGVFQGSEFVALKTVAASNGDMKDEEGGGDQQQERCIDSALPKFVLCGRVSVHSANQYVYVPGKVSLEH
jgi:hypothetical protein